jgi:UDP-N-acetyl-D-glucosamine dehydrogenase
MGNPTAIVGLGYVGLPLSLQFCRKGMSIVGLDIDFAKVEKLNRGESFIHHIPSASVAQEVS